MMNPNRPAGLLLRCISCASCITLTALVLLLASCGTETSAVVLWSPDTDMMANGSVVTVVSEGSDSAIIRLPEDGSNHTVDLWRIAIFPSAAEAANYAEKYEAVAETTAVSQRNALPVRQEPRSNSSIVYRLREGETIKVIGHTDTPVIEGNLEDFWYEVLTDSGVHGHVFGFHLQLIDPSTALEQDREDMLDEQLQALLVEQWRPIGFRRMINDRQIDLQRLRSRYGLFFDTEEQRIDIVLSGDSFVYGYDEIQQTNSSSYLFTGADVQIRFLADDEIRVQFPVGSRTQSESFVLIDDDLGEIREREEQRREDLLASLREGGNELSSTAYGTIVLNQDGTFMWSGYDRLQPRVLPAGLSGTGELDFSYFLSRELRSQYDGAVGFRFDGRQQTVVFLFELINSGLRLTHAPDSTISNSVVESVSMSPTILFFQYLPDDDQDGPDDDWFIFDADED
ncbi:SH3 domain-containing protein [Spirochaeta africana]|uniref:SH3b domain-containing protein n=1 Tax=Spirochaeta africana (strain ATCC 700263 / DSM 8902 / Z-7692) TaxID=889378 RepID=H9UK33_SPIAZ|nr:SH3 domain-containing protein [Spirochaeta africana]AFG37876.1 hypothetical protein Spiaf_1819 [Spirochaeta africana DSM 8902]